MMQDQSKSTEENKLEAASRPLRSIAPALRRAATLLGVVILLMLLLIGWRSWQSAATSAYETGLGLQQLVHNQTERMFEVAEVLLEHASDLAKRTDFSDPTAQTEAQRNLRLVRRAATLVSSIWIVNAEGKVVATTVPGDASGAAEPLDLSERSFFRLHAEGNKAILLSGPAWGQLSDRPYFALSTRLEDDQGKFLGVVLVALNPIEIASYFTSVPQSFGAQVMLFRGSGEVLVAVPDPKDPSELVNLRAPDAFLQAAGTADVATDQPTEVGSAFVWKLRGFPVYVAVEVPRSLVVERWIGQSWHLILSVAAAGMALIIAFFALHRRALAEARVADELKREVARQTAELRRALHEKELLLRELHHRVKNNLQVVMSLLSLQAQRSKGDPRSYFAESQRRLAAIAKMHQHLYLLADTAELSLVPYLRELAREIAEAYGAADRVILDIEGDSVAIGLDQATSVVLVAAEVMGNAFKHAFADRRNGRLRVRVKRSDTGVCMTISDDGPGFGAAEPSGSDSLGMLLIRNLAAQARGNSRFAAAESGGTRFEMDFELTLHADRKVTVS